MVKSKICYIVSNLNQGGAERQLVELIKKIDKVKYSVTLCIYDDNSIFYNELYEAPEVDIIMRKTFSTNRIVNFIDRLIFLRKFLVNSDFDLIQTMLFHNGLLVRFLLPRRYNNRILYSIRNNFDLFLQPQKKWKLMIEKKFLKKSIVICNTKYSADKFKSVINSDLREHIDYIYNGYDNRKFYKEDGMQSSKTIIGLVGRQTYQKNHIQALEIASTLPENVEIHIYGAKGDKTEELSNYVKEHNLGSKVYLHSPSTNMQLIYNSFDVFLLTSHFEGCPNVVFEAMLCQIPVVISEGANTDGFIISGTNGYVYDGTNESLIRELNHCVCSENTNIISNAYEYVLNNFTLDAMVTKYQDLYNTILQKK